jgi:N-glycosylase/DNA lyase
MQKLAKKVLELKNSPVAVQVNSRIAEFEQVHAKGNEEWFSELCFCLLTANTSAAMGLKMQAALSYNDLAFLPESALKKKMNSLRCRFFNRRAEFIVQARKNLAVRDKVKSFENESDARLWLAQNTKGLGMKEASHFLRNVGYKNSAILDKHVLNLLTEHKVIERPKTLSPKKYLEIEKTLEPLCQKTSCFQGELDLYLWYLKTGKVLK